MSECLRNGCTEGRRDLQGSSGRFCSDECLHTYRREKTGNTHLTNALTRGIEGEIDE